MNPPPKHNMVREIVFDAFVDLHGRATIDQLRTHTGLADGPLRTAITALRIDNAITGARQAYAYELTETAARPVDRRGRKTKSR